MEKDFLASKTFLTQQVKKNNKTTNTFKSKITLINSKLVENITRAMSTS